MYHSPLSKITCVEVISISSLQMKKLRFWGILRLAKANTAGSWVPRLPLILKCTFFSLQPQTFRMDCFLEHVSHGKLSSSSFFIPPHPVTPCLPETGTAFPSISLSFAWQGRPQFRPTVTRMCLWLKSKESQHVWAVSRSSGHWEALSETHGLLVRPLTLTQPWSWILSLFSQTLLGTGQQTPLSLSHLSQS